MKRLVELIGEAKRTEQNLDAYAFLPDIIESLELIQSELEGNNPDSETLIRRARGLGRLVTESYAFSESPLGSKLLVLVTDIASKHSS